MSKVNKKGFCLLAILILFSLFACFAWGCKSNRTPVESVSFDLVEIGDNKISLLVGDEFSPKINFVPSFASNKDYSLSSSNDGVLRVVGHKISAVAAGRAVLTVVADDNNIIQNTILVTVYAERTTLPAPNIKYNQAEQKFYFNEILGAGGYTISINGNEINLGGRLEYSLAEYSKTYRTYDVNLTAKVRADAPSYNHSLQSSDYGNEINIFQVGPLEDVKVEAEEGVSYLSFEHDASTSFNVTINGEEFLTNTADKKISLMNLPEKFAGQTVVLQITALAQENGENCYPFVGDNLYINVLDTAKPQLNASVVVWDAVPFAAGYNVYVNGEIAATTTKFSFNLYDYLGRGAQINELRVQPVLAGRNLATTGKLGNTIKFAQYDALTLSVDGENLAWSKSDDANFSIELFEGDTLVRSYATAEPSFDLSKIDSSIYEVKVKKLAQLNGDVYYLSSPEATIKISRLKTPELTYKKQENEFFIVDENAENIVENYTIEYLGGKFDFASKTIEGFAPTFAVGKNEFRVSAIAKGEVAGVIYLDSASSNLTINKLKTATAISLGQNDFALEGGTGFFNYLKIETDVNKEYILNLRLKIGGDEILLTADNFILTDDENRYALPCVFEGGNYYVALLDELYNPLIEELKNSALTSKNFGVVAVFSSRENNEVSSDEQAAEFSVCAQSVISAASQNIEIKNVNQSSEVENYFVLINGQTLMNLGHFDAQMTGEKIVVKFKNFVETLSGQIDANEPIELKVLHCFESSLSTISDKFEVQLAKEPDINISKNVVDLAANNGVKIGVDVPATAFEKQYVFKIYNDENLEQTLVFDGSGEVAFYLEEIAKYADFKDEIFVSAHVTILSQAQTGPYMFNSFETEPIQFNKIAAVEGLKIDNGILTFAGADDDVAFYEIYTLNGEEYSLLGTTKTTSFDLVNLDGENFNFAVKAISAVAGGRPTISNSDFSASIAAKKLELLIDIKNGDFVITCSKLNEIESLLGADLTAPHAYLKVQNLTSGNEFNFTPASEIDGLNFDFENNKIDIEARALLNYGTNLTQEDLSFQLIVEYGENDNAGQAYFVNSKREETSVFGLVRAGKLNVKYTTESNNEIVDFIEWKNESNPVDLAYNYVLKLTYDGTTYSSLDGKFESNGNSINMGENKIKLPTKFTYNSGDSVDFNAGVYHLEIKIYPLTTSGVANYCSSEYAAANIELLASPEMTAAGGGLSWRQVASAQGYQLKFSASGKPAIYLSTTKTYFDFGVSELLELSGIISVQIQAVSQLKNSGGEILTSVANSSWSDALTVYKLPNVENATIDDGMLVLTASKLFAYAEIDFVCGDTTTTYVLDNIYYLNGQLSQFDGLKLDGLNPQILSKITDLMQARKYIIDLTKEDKFGNTINLLDGMNYTISVRLIGNNIDVGEEVSLPIVNSNKISTNLNALQLQKAEARAVERGKLNFSLGTNVSLNGLNYNFNEADPMLIDAGDLKARVYRIEIKISGVEYSIYALDYDYFAERIKSLTSEYKTLTGYGTLYGYLKLNSNGKDVYLNVYKDQANGKANILDFNATKIYYYATQVVRDDESGTISYSSDVSISEIDVATGGNFEVDVYLLGGDADAEQTIANLNSCAMERYFVRYATNSLSTFNGELRFKDLTPLDEDSLVLDHPIYKVAATSTSGTKTIYLYYGENNLDAVKKLIADDKAEFVEISKFVDEQDTKFVWFEISKLLDGPIYYDITIQTLAGLGVNDNSNYLLSAVEASEKLHVYKLGQAKMSIDRTTGARIQFSLAERETLAYEITLTDTRTAKNYVYFVDGRSAGAKVLNGNFYYTLPRTIITNMGEHVDTTATYSISVRSMANEQNVINGAYGDGPLNIRRAEDVSSYQIENGQLTFSAPASVKNVYVRLGYRVEGETKYLYFSLANNNEAYTFNDRAIYQVEGASYLEAVTAGKTYTLSVYPLGYQDNDVWVLNGAFYDDGVEVNRLATVENLEARHGVLSWDAVAGAEKYVVTISGQNARESETAAIDLFGLAAGEYEISVRAIGSDKINAMDSETKHFVKLAAVNDEFELNGNMISWQPVDGAQEYYAEFEYALGEEIRVDKRTTSTASIEAPAQLNGQFTLRVQARVVDISDTLNSEFTTYQSSIEVPHSVESINWEPDEYRIKIVTAEDFGANDSIQLVYRVKKYVYSNKNANLDGSAITKIVDIPYSAQSNNVYYFYPTIMGQYLEFSAIVVRENSLSSGRMLYRQSVDLHLFSAGDGEETPYAINDIDDSSASQQLLNIKYRSDAKFVLGQSVDLSKLTISNYDGVISEEFSGELDGGGFAITGINLNVTDSNFSLFKTLNKAKIYNLNLGLTNNSIKLTCAGANEIYLAPLAQKANDSTLQQITLRQTEMTISGRSDNNVYVAGLVAIAQNTSFLACSATVELAYSVRSNLTKYVGGLVARAAGGRFADYDGANTTATLTVKDSSKEPDAVITYLGGLVGEYRSSAQSKGAINSVKTKVTINSTNAQNVGGIAGYISFVDIENSEATGTIGAITLTAQSKINLGGLVGTMQGASLKNSGVNIVFDISKSSSLTQNSGIRIGVLVGEISSVGDEKSTISQCYSYTPFAQGVTNLGSNPFTLGVCGFVSTAALDGSLDCTQKTGGNG